MHERDQLVLRSIGGGITVLTLLLAIRRMKLNAQEAYAVAEVLRDCADEIEHREEVSVQ